MKEIITHQRILRCDINTTCSASIYCCGDRKGCMTEKKNNKDYGFSVTQGCSTLGYILGSTRLSGGVFAEADITKYGPLEEIKSSYQEAWWSLPSRTDLLLLSCALKPSDILFATLSFIFHAFPFCISTLLGKLPLSWLLSAPPPPLFPCPLQQSTKGFLGGVQIYVYSPRAHLVSAWSHHNCAQFDFHCKCYSFTVHSHSFFASFCSLHVFISQSPFTQEHQPDTWCMNCKGFQPNTLLI